MNKSKVQVLLIFREVWTKLKIASPALAWGGAVMLFASLITLGLSVIDPRLFQGVSVWHKPWKFQILTVLYWWSLAWFISYFGTTEQFSLSRRFIVWMSLIAGLFEVVYMQHQCYSCHGTQGQGGERNAGPKIFPNPTPFVALELQMRTPRNVMPRYSVQNINDVQLKDLYAYVENMQPSPAVSLIPLLQQAMR